MSLLSSIRNNIPNGVTSMNLLCGTLAVIASFRPFDVLCCGFQGYQCAMLLIALAAVFDFFDGFVARLLHSVSNLGAELDSLSDLVSFGLAPAMMLYNMMVRALPEHQALLSLATVLIPIFGALRLARFNVDNTQTTTFRGLPIPGNAIFWIGFCSWYATHHDLSVWIVVTLIVALSLLMVCPLRMFSLKMHGFSVKRHFRQVLLVLAAVAFCALAGVGGLAWLIIFYVALSACAPEPKNETLTKNITE